ncbi:hypothetical protein IC607_15905 [Cellulomonas sp. JH27-2]|uniref:hypothetical protein n=1 Tax=Cellulomonas sp. JH27-2 TaxID=2774139 RepID=UPI001786A9DD|nr:hypothetical protein [Cellulomonas sp. JH27-2]MBD8060451.1 hypothetical protein [Cellulomonas sp. JH27-2]
MSSRPTRRSAGRLYAGLRRRTGTVLRAAGEQLAPPAKPAMSGVLPTTRHKLTGLAARDERVDLRAWVGSSDYRVTPDGFHVALVERGSGRRTTVKVKPVGPVTEDGCVAVSAGFRIGARALAGAGPWEVLVAPTWAGREGAWSRLGTSLTRGMPRDGAPVGGGALIVEFEGASDGLLISRASGVPDIAVVEVRADDDGRPEAVVTGISRPNLRAYAQLSPAGSRAARHRLPYRDAGAELTAVRLPVPPPGSTEPVQVALSVAVDGVLRPVVVPESAPVASFDGFRVEQLVGALLVVRQEGVDHE